jgi:hypothetical protein
MKNRIQLEDSFLDIITKLSEGNPGALTVLITTFKENPTIDPDDAFENIGAILSFDSYGIYGSRIWMLFKDVCHQNIILMLACLRAVQLGLLSESVLQYAIDNYGQGLIPEDVLKQVQTKLPRFGKNSLNRGENGSNS